MSLSLLYPLALLGALAVAAPIWLHLRRKRETNLFPFSALRFLDDMPHPQRSPLRLRDLFLFALRVLALLLLACAFAWPYFRDTNRSVVAESRVYVLDNTLSHQVSNGFVRDRDRIISDMAQAASDIQVAVVELTSQPRTVASFGDDRERARQNLKALEPSCQRGSYLAAFRQANALLANSLGDRKRIIFYGDNQENQWNENLNTPPFLQNVDVTLPKVGTGHAPNLSLAEPHVQRIFLGDKSLVNFTVKFSHQGEARQANIVLRANEQVIFNKPLDLEKQPETILLQAQWEADPALWLRGEVSVDGIPDALAGDNRIYFTQPPVREGKVALLAQSSYLRLALSAEIMRGHWATRVLQPTTLAEELAASQDAEVLCIESGYLQSADARKLVWRYLTNGRGVILLVNRLTPAVNGALRELGFEPQTFVESKKAQKFQYIFSNHPIFHPFLSPDYGNLMEVKVLKHARLKAMQAMPLIFSEAGDVLFFQGTKFPGKLLVSAFGLEREQTSWPLHLTFIPFLDLALQHCRPEDPAPTNYEPGEISVLSFAPDSSVREVVLREGGRELRRAPVIQSKAQLRMPENPGLYAVAYDAAIEPEKILSVNPSPKESRLNYVDAPEAMKVWKLDRPREAIPSSRAAARAELSLAGILQQQWWWYVLLAALAILVVETVWSASRKAHV